MPSEWLWPRRRRINLETQLYSRNADSQWGVFQVKQHVEKSRQQSTSDMSACSKTSLFWGVIMIFNLTLSRKRHFQARSHCSFCKETPLANSLSDTLKTLRDARCFMHQTGEANPELWNPNPNHLRIPAIPENSVDLSFEPILHNKKTTLKRIARRMGTDLNSHKSAPTPAPRRFSASCLQKGGLLPA